MKNSKQANEVRIIWNELFHRVFNKQLSDVIIKEKLKYFGNRTEYINERNNSSEKVVKLINDLLLVDDLPVDYMGEIVSAAELTEQQFLFDRFLYMDEHLKQLGEKDFYVSDKSSDFVRYGLIDIWDARLRQGEWS